MKESEGIVMSEHEGPGVAQNIRIIVRNNDSQGWRVGSQRRCIVWGRDRGLWQERFRQVEVEELMYKRGAGLRR